MYNSKMIAEFEQDLKHDDLTVLDVRELDEYNNGHIKNALHLPLSQISELVKDLDSSKYYHVICHSGGRSAMACEFLSAHGFDVTNVMGGMSAWKGEVAFD